MNAYARPPATMSATAFRRPEPSPAGAPEPGPFRLARLSKVSGVDIGTIANWTARGIWNRRAEHEGKHRRFDFWDCLHLAIIREMAAIGLQLSGRGAVLSESLLAVARDHVGWEGLMNYLPTHIALYAANAEAEWRIDYQNPPERLPRSYVVINLRAVVEDVHSRYFAATTTQP